jgi:hypothetical protein
MCPIEGAVEAEVDEEQAGLTLPPQRAAWSGSLPLLDCRLGLNQRRRRRPTMVIRRF